MPANYKAMCWTVGCQITEDTTYEQATKRFYCERHTVLKPLYIKMLQEASDGS